MSHETHLNKADLEGIIDTSKFTIQSDNSS